MQVRIHFNLQKACFAISYDRKHVAEYRDAVCVRNATFVTSEATHRRIKRINRRKVYAWIDGDLCDCHETNHQGVDVTINPWRNETNFVVRGTSTAVHSADHVSLWLEGEKPETRGQGAVR